MRRVVAAGCIALLLSTRSAPANATLVVPPSPVASYPVGQHPAGLVVDQPDGLVYVTNSGMTPNGTGTISVVDPTHGTVTSLATTKPAGFLALDGGMRRLYSSNYDQRTDTKSFDEIDLATGAVIPTLGIGGLGIALDASSNRVFVAGGSLLYAVDTATFTVAQTRSASAGQTWFGLAHDPALHHLYVTNITSVRPSVVVLDDRDLSTVGEIALATAPRFALAVDAVSHALYVAGADVSGPPFAGSAVYVIDGTTLTITTTATFRGYPNGLVLWEPTHRLYVVDAYGYVSLPSPGRPVYELDMGTLSQTLTLISPGQPAFPAVGSDGRLYVTNDGGALDVYDLTPRNVPPEIDSVTMTPMVAETNEVLNAHVQAHDPNGDPIMIAYQWYVNTRGQQRLLVGETSPTLDMSKPGNGDRDDLMCISVSVSDGTLSTSTSWCFLFVRDSAPVVSVALSPSTATVISTVRATANAADADGDPTTYTYTWKVNGLVRRTMTTGVASDALELSLLGDARKGDSVSVEVVATD